MSRTVGRGVNTPKETVESLKKELETVRNAGAQLIIKNQDLENKLKEKTAELEKKNEEVTELTKKNQDLENKLKKETAKAEK